MVSVNHVLRGATCASLLVFSGAALAHFPLMQCWSKGETIECEAGYSDGSKAVDYQVRMFDYDDNLIGKAMTDKRSIATFTKSADEYYIVFDSGHEFPIEVDGVEISEK